MRGDESLTADALWCQGMGAMMAALGQKIQPHWNAIMTRCVGRANDGLNELEEAEDMAFDVRQSVVPTRPTAVVVPVGSCLWPTIPPRPSVLMRCSPTVTLTVDGRGSNRNVA